MRRAEGEKEGDHKQSEESQGQRADRLEVRMWDMKWVRASGWDSCHCNM